MKKVLSVVIAMLMVLSVNSIGVVAVTEEKVPLVILQGYSGPNLAYADENGEPIFNEDGTVKLAWPLDFSAVGDDVMEILSNVALSQADMVEELTKKICQYLEPIGMNPDGTSKNNLVPYPSGAAATRASTLIENGMEKYIPEKAVAEMAMKEIGAENVFGFTFDWRRSQVDYAAALNEYIQEVKEITHSDKVDLYGLSHGGQYGTTYLYLYGDRGDVRRAMFGNPATLGTSFCGSLFTKEYIDVNLNDLVRFIEHGFEYEKDFEWLTMLPYLEEDILVPAANKVVTNDKLWNGIICIPSLWDFVPYNYFEEAVEFTGLNPVDNKELYTDTVAYHTMISNGTDALANKIQELQANGVQIGYVVGHGYSSINNDYNADILIDTYLSSGDATCAPINETFPEGYTQAGTVCKNPDHYHISPQFNIDASTGIAPDTTWYITNQGHGMIMHDEYSRKLVHDFLWGNIKNVYSSKEFPQFNESQNNGEILYARFDNTASGYHSTEDSALKIKNMSVESNVRIWSIEAVGADIDFKYEAGMEIPMGKIVSLEAVDNDFDNADIPFAVNITYTLVNSQLTSAVKSFKFTPMNDDQMFTFNYLSQTAQMLEDEDPTEPTTDSETESTTEPTTESTTAEKENVTGDIPDTANTTTVKRAGSIVFAAVALAGVSVTAGAVVKKRKEDE